MIHNFPKIPLAFLLFISSAYASTARDQQNILPPNTGSNSPFNSNQQNRFYEFPNEIKRVAVIGGGPNGLVYTSTLLEHGFEVRMFEKAPEPGGNWFYTPTKPVHASFPYVL